MRAWTTRRTFLKALGGLAAGAAFPAVGGARPPASVIAGAIRWDAWSATGGYEIPAVEKTLGPASFHARAPFCATFPGADQVEFSQCATQNVLDQEIRYARKAGLSYWAYCWYGVDDPMMMAWRLHQKSQIRNDMNWCLLLQGARIGTPDIFGKKFAEFVSYFKQTNYQKTPDQRPLLYLLVDSVQALTKNFGDDFGDLQKAFADLASECSQEGLQAPYVVIMDDNSERAAKIVRAIGGGAISAYAPPLASGNPATFALQTTVTEKFWRDMAATGSEVVPICVTGWDIRARRLNPPPWMHGQKPGANMQSYVMGGSPAEIKDQIRAARQFVLSNAKACESRCLLIYSWNECDEGGTALVPHRVNGRANTDILDAVAAGLAA